VRRDQHVGERQESCQHVVFQDLSGKVLKEDSLLFFVNVEGHPAKPSAFQCVDQGRRINELPAADVDEDLVSYTATVVIMIPPACNDQCNCWISIRWFACGLPAEGP